MIRAFSPLKKLSTLPPIELRTLAEALVVSAGLTLLIKAAPSRLPMALIRRAAARRVDCVVDAEPALASVTSAVARVATTVPATTCLARALAGSWMLSRRGVLASLRVGVRKQTGEALQIHAWIEYDGKQIIGAQPGADFTPFPAIL